MSLELIAALLGLLTSTVSITVAVISVNNNRRQTQQVQFRISEAEKPDKCKGLILLLGPTKGTSFDSVEYHLTELKHCWLVGSEASSNTSAQLRTSFPNIEFHDYSIVNIDEIYSTYQTVLDILNKDMAGFELDVKDIIADITGGLKTMSAGMVLACVENRCRMEYMKSLRDQEGNPIRSQPTMPIRVDLEFSRSENRSG